MRIVAKNISKRFQNRWIFKDKSFELPENGSLAISGPNGSGKSTMVKIISGLLMPTKGETSYFKDRSVLNYNLAKHELALVSPYLQFYKNLSAMENLSFIAKAKTGRVDVKRIESLMEKLGLKKRLNDELRNYSSGMLQRVKYVGALYAKPKVLILDEPTANLDEDGKSIIYSIIEDQKKYGSLVIATNETEELAFATQRLTVA